MGIATPKQNPKFVLKYGWNWPATLKPLEIELACIRKGGKWREKYANGTSFDVGLGLFEHYMNARKLAWPDRYRHRWTDLEYKTVLDNQVTFLLGSASSQKSSFMSEYALLTYWASPHNTVVLVSSTARDKLEQAIFGEMKKLWLEAKRLHKHLAGHPVEYKQAILTDKLVKQKRSDDESDDIEFNENVVRDHRKGIVCKAAYVGAGASTGGGTYVGLGAFAGIKQENVIFIADELQFMAPTFLDALTNMRSNVAGYNPVLRNKYFGLKVIASGNPNHNPESQMGIAAEPLDGWNSVENITKTTVWPVRTQGGVCLNLIGIDSPNFDQDHDIYPKLIGRDHARQVEAQWGKDSPQYEAQVMGRMKMSLASSRVITRDICRIGYATEKAIWAGSPRIKIHSLDPSYGGGDRCISTWGEFGEAMDGSTILRVTPPKLIRISMKDERTPEDQIAQWVKRELEDHDIPVTHSYYDSTGKGTIGFAMAKVFGETCPTPVSSGEKPTSRPVRQDLFIDSGGVKRLKRCDEHYSKFVTEMWFSVREAIEAGQIREMTDDVIAEGCSRMYRWVSGDRIEIEAKDEMRKRIGKSPDLFDSLAILVEGARRQGFKIKRLGFVEPPANKRSIFEDQQNAFRTVLKSKMLQRN
jgi:hypothetical protein